ncbi:MAG: flagellar hook-basal body complex protein [Lachnospiraceae bacterium]|nr:flagellar hook-basal body complex protein [Lachnospiraceae bacterium]
MMRALYSGVAGLKTHQIKMDVIGNNIANVNTTAYKSQSITFSELMYQTTQAASGPNETTGTAGVNAKQIGLGVTSGAISTAITTAGATQTTGNPFDIRITGDSFFIVNDGMNNYFTRDGSFYVDAAGNLAMTANGYNVMGWGVDPATQTIKQDIVEPLRIMSADNLTYPPEATTKAYVSGILDKNDTNAASADGKVISVSIYDGLGYSYTAKFAIKNLEEEGQYTVELTDILDGTTNESLKDRYNVGSIKDIATFGEEKVLEETVLASLLDEVTYNQLENKYYKKTGFSETFSDYDANRVSGITYTVADPEAVKIQGLLTADEPDPDTVTMNGTGTLSKDDLEEAFNLIYVVDTTDPEGNYYYYKDAEGTEYKLRSDNTSDGNWAKVLNKTGLTGFDATLDADGNVSFTFTQDFTVAGNVTFDGTNFTKEITIEEAYGVDTTKPNTTYEFMVSPDGQAQITSTTILSGNTLVYDTATGEFKSINGADTCVLDFSANAVDVLGNPVDLTHFSDVSIDWTASSMFNNNKTSTIGMVSGDKEGLGSGRKLGELSGVSIQNNGMIYASYDNGQTRLLGQIAVASFSNASGLQKEGENLYSATLNSGEFDGIGVDVTAGGGYMSTGVLEMSNVDLSAEFTEMITTQRGFQANSRIITVSDTLLEELVNLKR